MFLWMVRKLVMLWGCCWNSPHKLAVNPEKAQTLTRQGIALAVGNVTALRISVVFLS